MKKHLTRFVGFALFSLRIAIVSILIVPIGANATGPVVGTNCVATWSAVTTNTDGTAIAGAITYNLYLAAGTPTTPPGTPTLTGITVLTASPCNSLAPGQYTFWLTAVETPTAGGSSSESTKSAAFPFALVVPNTPNGVGIK